MRKLLVAVGVLAVLGLVAGLFALRNLDALVRSAIQDVGTRAAGAPVSVEHVHIDVGQGSGTIRGLVVGNPEGFEAPHAFALGTIHVDVEPEALLKSPVVVRSVRVEGCDVRYEWRPGGSNVATIRENVAAFVEGLPGTGPPREESDATRLVIERLVIVDGRIDVSAPFLGGRQVGAPLPRIVLEDVGAKDGGATPGQIAAILLAELTGGVLDAVAGLGIDGLSEVRRLGEGVIQGAGRILEGLLGR